MKILNFSLVFFILVCQSDAQSIRAIVDSKKVEVGQIFDLTFDIKGNNFKNFNPPNFDNFELVSGPSRSTSTTIINGVMSTNQSYSYKLRAKTKGEFEIKSVTAIFGNIKKQSNSLKIVVVPAKKVDIFNSDGDFPEVFVQIETSQKEFFTGQQIILDYKLYSSININSARIVKDPEIKDFFIENISRFSSNPTEVKLKGKGYVSQIIRRLALYPQQAGEYAIEPTQFSVDEIVGKSRSRLFNIPNIKTRYIATDSLKLLVNSVPKPSPPTYTGGVGTEFFINMEIPSNRYTTDDAIPVKLTLHGNGDIKRIQAPNLNLPEYFEVYAPKLLKESIYENRGEIYGRKTYEYLLLPLKPISEALKVTYTYFDPVNQNFNDTLATTPIIYVKQGKDKMNRDINLSPNHYNQIQPDAAAYEITSKPKPIYGTLMHWLACILPLIGALIIVFVRYKQDTKPTVDTKLLRKIQAASVAKVKLAKAESLKFENAYGKAFYQEIYQALMGYASDRLGMSNSLLQKDHIVTLFINKGVSEDLVQKYISLLTQSEMYIYAPHNNQNQSSDYDTAIGLITQIEEQFNIEK